MTAALDLAALVGTRRVIVCCGSGGVGKTTSAAALGMLAARQGAKSLVMTIDPARRLAQAMGLAALGHEPQRVQLAASGELWAMMLDSKHDFDRLVEQLAPDAKAKDVILANRYYQQISTALGGSRELIAMERVLEAVQEGSYDVVIVDTPPTQHALDFLDAPTRILNLLNGSMTSLLLRPYGIAARAHFKFFRQSTDLTLRFFERLTGVQLFADLSDFMLAFSGLFEGFKARSRQVQQLLRGPNAAFLLVCAPEPGSLRQARLFASRLGQEGMSIAGVLANRVHEAPAGGQVRPDFPAADQQLLKQVGRSDDLATRLGDVWDRALQRHRADVAALAEIADTGLPVLQIPHLRQGLSGSEDLQTFATLLANPSR